MNTRRHQVALYVASLEVSQDCLNRLQRIFDTSQDYPEIPPNPGYIHHIVEADTWANDLGLEEIYERHRREYYPTFYAKPIAVVDRRTSEDESVILIAPELGENGEFETKWFRIDSVKVVSAAMNLEISNQSVDDVSFFFSFHTTRIIVERGDSIAVFEYCLYRWDLEKVPRWHSLFGRESERTFRRGLAERTGF